MVAQGGIAMNIRQRSAWRRSNYGISEGGLYLNYIPYYYCFFFYFFFLFYFFKAMA
jgi:hypothetical protein